MTDHAAARLGFNPGLDPQWQRQASTDEAGRVWQAAAPWADSDPLAARATGAAEQRLRDLHPDAMRIYDGLLNVGADRGSAMQAATEYAARHSLVDEQDAWQHRAAGEQAEATPDVPATRVDEHAQAAPDAAVHHGAADAAQARHAGNRGAAQLAGGGYARTPGHTRAHHGPHRPAASADRVITPTRVISPTRR